MERDNTMTRRFLADAGVTADMQVLEIGCGNGEVTQLLAELVGPGGRVVAVDRNEAMLAQARERMAALGIGHVRFLEADLTGDPAAIEDLPPAGFDVLAGRRVLMYLPDPVAVLAGLSGRLRRGGIVVFEELDVTTVPARTRPFPAHDQATSWLRGMLAAEGAHLSLGFELPDVMVRAGLEFHRIRAEAVIQGQGTQFPLAHLVSLLAPRLVAAEVADQAEIAGVVTRLEEEAADPTGVYISEMSFCAWGRKP